ncbi:Glutamine--fructose-6-phosphate aminotransferase [isomerizing] [bioreactor metagenome]|uniref:Glutamine--fructose-6-phosphate aminotransferase [isomerizing] n=1 Tax=bioreactor metagenome TaxID=1076179 RepID=A0A645CN15_9ZZZZ
MSQKNGFEHYMLKEIYEQPQIIRNMLQKRVKEDYILMNELTRVNIDLKNAERVYIVACGSAYHAGMVGKYVIEELCKIPVEVDYASEFRYREPLMNKHTPVIFISQSGETADTLASLRLANEKGATTIGIVNVKDSSIARECDCVLYTEAGTEIAVATTKGYTSQLMMLYLFALNIMQLKNDISKEALSRFIRQLKNIPQKMDNIIYDTSDILTLADEYYTKENIFFIGRNMDYALSLEGSLKLKEISYINSQAYPAGELKHGTIALIDDQSLVIALCANKRLLPKTVSNVEETTARGAQIICLTPRENQELFDSRTKFIFIEKMDDILMPLVEIIPLQLFAYYVAKNKGADIDMPKNLAKSVTVE